MRVAIAGVATLFLAMVFLVFHASRDTNSGLPRAAPRLELETLNGGHFSLEKLRGEVVLVNFWATWCPPCVAETPSLVALWQRMEPRGLRMVGVSVDTDESALRRFVASQGILYPTVRDPGGSTAHRFGTFKYPETYLIDRSGQIVRRWVGALDWAEPTVIAELESRL